MQRAVSKGMGLLTGSRLARTTNQHREEGKQGLDKAYRVRAIRWRQLRLDYLQTSAHLLGQTGEKRKREAKKEDHTQEKRGEQKDEGRQTSPFYMRGGETRMVEEGRREQKGSAEVISRKNLAFLQKWQSGGRAVTVVVCNVVGCVVGG